MGIRRAFVPAVFPDVMKSFGEAYSGRATVPRQLVAKLDPKFARFGIRPEQIAVILLASPPRLDEDQRRVGGMRTSAGKETSQTTR
jgi:hypothetical protein